MSPCARACVVVCLSAAAWSQSADRWREPVALAAAPGADSFFVACADGGLVRVDGERVAAQWNVAASLSDLVALDDGVSTAATDLDRARCCCCAEPTRASRAGVR